MTTLALATQTPPTAAPAQPDVSTILEVGFKEHVLWTMPRDVYELVAIGLENWRLTYGGHRRPKGNVDRVLQVLEDGGCPGIRAKVTREVKPAPEPAIRGHKADVHIDDLFPYTPCSAP